MNSPKDIISHYRIKPHKRMGQSFLIDSNIIRKIASLAIIEKNDIVVEIGAGIGVLTELLAKNAANLIAVELDYKLVDVLKERFAGHDNVEIYSGDILKFDFSKILKTENQKITVIGNIPYNISSPLLFHMLSFRKYIGQFLLMLQAEVVQRITARPACKEYGITSIIIQMFADAENIMNVPASCFYPSPKVESSIIRGRFLNNPVVELIDENHFMILVRDSFAQRRKMIINNLKQSKLMESFSESRLRDLMISVNINPNRRGETLSVKEFGILSNTFVKNTVRHNDGL
jgi:16S rRNA (adenine1518-N6/adenine1519-N6)-dimethyltransferase